MGLWLVPGGYWVRPGLSVVPPANPQVIDGAEALLDTLDFRRLDDAVLEGDDLQPAFHQCQQFTCFQQVVRVAAPSRSQTADYNFDSPACTIGKFSFFEVK